MHKIDTINIITSIEQVTLSRLQDGLLPFVEKPSDQYDEKDVSCNSINNRIKAQDLFSLFTADIINEQVLFIR